MKKYKWFVYIIECLDNSYYVGMTWCIELRYDQHFTGLGSVYTSKHGVKKLVYFEEFESIEQARLREKQIKGWTRIKKEKLISGVWKKI